MRFLLLCLVFFSCYAQAEYRESFMKSYGCKTYEFFRNTEYRDVALAVLFQAAFESAWGTAHWVPKRNQVFALKVYTGGAKEKGKRPWEYIREFDSFEDALVAQLNYYRKRKYPGNHDGFVAALERHRYAQMGDYAKKVDEGAESMKKYVRKHCGCEVK